MVQSLYLPDYHQISSQENQEHAHIAICLVTERHTGERLPACPSLLDVNGDNENVSGDNEDVIGN